MSPVIITVRIPMWRRIWKRALMPGLMMSLRNTTPNNCSWVQTSSGVPPWRAMWSTAFRTGSGTDLRSRER
ncbi:hypothetical protein D3C84_1217300 [compost metagenome]